MARTTVTFQLSPANNKRLKPLRKIRGAQSQAINRALDLYFSQTKNPGAVDLLRKFMLGMASDAGVSAKDWEAARVICNVKEN